MKVTYNWLKDFVDIKISPQALAAKLTMAGLEVISLEERGGDSVFEIEITSNRADWLSVIGIAREVAAITGKKLKIAPTARITAPAARGNTIEIKIENKKDCPLYSAKIIKEVRVAPSPDWLKNRLELIGLRSVNNIVDITNYILFTYGEPLHAFDLDKLSAGRVFIRRAKKDEKIATIEGTQNSLDTDILVIADERNPVAIAGIMGGKDTEVTFNTKNILLEAAIFDPVLTRRARRKLGIQTDSSYRFERGIDFEVVINASWQAVKLIQGLCGGKIVSAKSAGITKIKEKSVDLNCSSINRILGVEIPAPKVKKILSDLGFKARAKLKNKFSVLIPGHRQDIVLEQDLIEEIARIYGYGSIPNTLPAVALGAKKEKIERMASLVKNMLVGLGLNEAITYSLIDKDLLAAFSTKSEERPIEVQNPLSKGQEVLRPTAIPSLCSRVAYNLNQKQEHVNLFEISRAFLNHSLQPKEELILTIAICGIKSYVLKEGIIKEGASLLDLKGIMETLFEGLGIKAFDFKMGQDGAGIYLKNEKIGVCFQLEKSALDKIDIKNKEVFALEVSLDKIFAASCLEKTFFALPRYPGVTRDISFIIKESISVREMLGSIKDKGGSLLKEAKVADYYKGKQIPAGFRALTISCLYRCDERTLTEAEVNPLHTVVSNALTERFGAKIR